MTRIAKLTRRLGAKRPGAVHAWTSTLLASAAIALVGAGVAPEALSAGADAPLTFEKEDVDREFSSGYYTSIAYDAAGNAHVAYQSRVVTGAQVRYARQNALGGWGIEIVDTNDFPGQHCDIVLDSDGNPHIAYWDSPTDELRFASRVGGVWSIDVLDTVDGLANLDLDVDSQGAFHIGYSSYVTAELVWLRQVGGIWSSEVLDDDCTTGIMAFCLDPNDKPLFLHRYQESVMQLTKQQGSNWYTYGFYGVTASEVAIDADASGAYHAAFQGDTRDWLTYIRGVDGEWSWAAVDTSSAGHVSIAVEPNGTPHFSYRRTLGDEGGGNLGYATTDAAGDIVVEEVDWYVDDARWTAIAVDREGNAGISYQEAHDSYLKVAEQGLDVAVPAGGEVWPVGAIREVRWSGVGPVDVLLSVDGGATYDELATNIGARSISFRVPHTPTRYARLRIQRPAPFLATAEVDSFLTIENDITLYGLRVGQPDFGRGREIAWSTFPSVEDLHGYRIERRDGHGDWREIGGLVRETHYVDPDGTDVSQYRLTAVNGFGHEHVLGTTTAQSATSVLRAWPLPMRAGSLHVAFASGSALGGGPGHVEVGVFDALGRRVRTLVDGFFDAGRHEVTWDGRAANGIRVSAGQYFVRSVSGGVTRTQKLTVLR